MDRNNMKSILGEQDFAAAIECDETRCLVQYGKILQAAKLVHGRVSQIGDSFVLYLSLTDVNTSRVESTATVTVPSRVEALADVVAEKTWDLVRDARQQGGTSWHTTPAD